MYENYQSYISVFRGCGTGHIWFGWLGRYCSIRRGWRYRLAVQYPMCVHRICWGSVCLVWGNGQIMSKQTIEYIQSICPELTPGECVMAAARLDTFNGFFAMVAAWRKSLPKNQQISPPRIKSKYRPYLIDTSANTK